MTTNLTPPPSRTELTHTQRKLLSRSLVALVLVGAALALWHRSTSSAPTATSLPSGTATQSPSSSPSSESPLSDQSLQTPEFSLTTTETRQLESWWAALMAAQALKSPMEQEAALSRCMTGMPPEIAAALLARMKREDLKGSVAGRLFDHWASAHPQLAVAWAQKQGDQEMRQSFMNVAALRWAVTDFKSASAWARSLPQGDARTDLMAAVASEAVRSDPLEALQLGFELPAGTAQANLFRRAAAEWAVKDRDSAIEWAKRIEDKELRQLVTEQVAIASAELDPVAAATIALQQMTPGTERDRAVVSIVQRWVQTDPKGASAWVRQFPEGALGRDAMDNLVNLWTDQDMIASGDWLLSLPAGELRNAGILAYARALARADAAEAQRSNPPTTRVR